ncbi:MAG: sulfatase [Mariniblastus sp.]
MCCRINKVISVVILLLFIVGQLNAKQTSRREVQQPDKATRLNVVWIVADDLSPDIGCYGTAAVSTPNLDQLAAKSVRYTNAFATSPACSPSRSAFVTSVFQTSLGAHHHRTRNKKPLSKNTPTVMECFRDAGYFVTNQGKTDYNFELDFKFDAKDWTERKPGQPFFAQFQIKPPHRDFEDNKGPSRPAKIQLPPQYPDHPITRTDWANYLQSVETMDRKVGELLKKLADEGLADSTAIFFFGDHGRPHVWGKQWLYDGGIQVPMLVHVPGAEPSVDHQLTSLLDAAPTSLKLAGLKVPAAMTGLDLLDSETPHRKMIFAARDRCGDAVDRIRSVRTAKFKYIRNYHPELPYSTRSSYKELQYPVLALSRVLHQQGRLTTAQARFFKATKPKEELYDISVDPHELNNLANSTEHQSVLGELSKSLDQWEIDTNDQGRVSEMSDSEMKTLVAEKKQWHAKTMKKRGLDPNGSDQDYLKWWSRKLKVEFDMSLEATSPSVNGSR